MPNRFPGYTLLLILGALVCACSTSPAAPTTTGQEPSREATPANQRTMVVAIRGDLPTLAAKPLVPFSGALNPPLFIFNAMLDYADENEVSRPMLAEALPKLNTDTWKVFPDGTMETTYKLKPNLTWHDGTPLTAADFVFGWQVYATPQFGTATTPPIGFMSDVQAPDDRTLIIRWKQPYPEAGALTDGTNIGLQALPRHILEESFGSMDAIAFTGLPFWTSEYVGLGPFKVDNWEPGSFIAASAFDGYVLGRPKIDRIEVRVIPDAQTATASLLSGDVHFISDFILSVTEGLTLEQEFPSHGGGSVIYSPVSLRSAVVQLRPDVAESPALLDVRSRRAIAFGLDSTSAVDVLTAGKGIETNTLTSPRVPYYAEIDKVITKYQYDPARAQRLMEEAGYTKGPDGFFIGPDGQTVQFSIASSAGPKNELEAATYTDSLKKAGFDASQKILPAAQIRDPEARALLPGLQIRGGGNRPVVYTSEQIPRASNRWRGDNRGGWSNPEYDRLFEEYNTTLVEADRIKLLAQLERVLTEQVPVVPLFFSAETNAFVAALQGPVARQTPNTSGTFLHMEQWTWRG